MSAPASSKQISGLASSSSNKSANKDEEEATTTETTPLVASAAAAAAAAADNDENNNNNNNNSNKNDGDEENDNEGSRRESLVNEQRNSNQQDYLGQMRPESCAYKLYFAFSALAVFLSACMIVLQVVSFRVLQRGEFLTDDILRTFNIILCLLFIWVEIPITNHLLPIIPLQHWIWRGFMYNLTSAISAQVAQASIYHMIPLRIPTLSEQLLVLIIKCNAASLGCVGMLYMFMGIFCLRGVMERIIQDYEKPMEEKPGFYNKRQDDNQNPNSLTPAAVVEELAV